MIDIDDLLEAKTEVDHVLAMHCLFAHDGEAVSTVGASNCHRCRGLRQRRRDIKNLLFPFLYGRSRLPA